MASRRRVRAGLVAIAALVLGGCGHASSGAEAPESRPASVELVPGSTQARVHLTASAAQRLGIETGIVSIQFVPIHPDAPPTTLNPFAAAAAGATPTSEPADHTGAITPTTAGPAPTFPPATFPPATFPFTTTTAVPTFPRQVVPFSAVMYLPSGAPYVYSSPASLEYVRVPVTIDYVVEGLAVLNNGPAVGTTVVTVGAAELAGVEFGAAGE